MPPIRFVFGLHLHQPVGNFDHVFEQHVQDVYRPILEHLSARGFLPAVLHLSGPLLEWLEQHDPAYLDQLGRLVSDGRIELLLAGFYEPVLASLPRVDRVEQIQWMQEAIGRRFGVNATGLWLTERVWEPELAADLALAGVRYALVDDRHFLVSGFSSDQLHAPLWTESDGKGLALFPIDERLRYLIPFRPPEETAAYLRELRDAGHRLAVLADDGEKFGGWPGTKEWVYQRGWLNQFMETISGLIERGEAQLSTLRDALEQVPSSGIAYLPTASYREMETWSLPPDAALRLIRLERDLGEGRIAGPDGALIRGSHWRNFLVKYSESNRMHKKMQALSLLSRSRGDPSAGARRAIGRGQCNDAYWHGVFGGLYLPHLRDAIWRNLAQAEGELRRGESLQAEVLDLDGDGHDEIWVHSDRFSAIVSPWRGGVVEEFTWFLSETNYANTLTRRREAYHDTALEQRVESSGGDGGTPSIHDLEEGLRLDQRPPVDAEARAWFLDRVLPATLPLEQYASADYRPVQSWCGAQLEYSIENRADGVEIVCRSETLTKRLNFSAEGLLSVSYRWDPSTGTESDWFAVELSLSAPMDIQTDPPAEIWSFAIETVAKSERGLDRTRQGTSLTVRWPVRLGAATIEMKVPAYGGSASPVAQVLQMP